MVYSSIFRTVDLDVSSYSGITQEQFMHIVSLIQADPEIFSNLAYLGD